MLTVYHLKPHFQGLLRPFVNTLARHRVSPNAVTLTSIALCSVVGAALGYFAADSSALLLLPAVLVIRMALNAADGMLARDHGLATPLGEILNELGDVFSDCALYIPLVFVPGLSRSAVVLFCMLAIISELTGTLGTRRSYAGPMGKSDRALVLGAMGLVLGLGVAPGFWSDSVLISAIVLLMVTIVNRSRAALEQRVT